MAIFTVYIRGRREYKFEIFVFISYIQNYCKYLKGKGYIKVVTSLLSAALQVYLQCVDYSKAESNEAIAIAITRIAIKSEFNKQNIIKRKKKVFNRIST